MPGGDGTGPGGQGPMTGRGLGYCAGYSSPGFTKGPGMGMAWGRGRAAFGAGRGMAWGRGRGRGRRIWAAPAYQPGVAPQTQTYGNVPSGQLDKDQELNMLKQEKNYLESELEGIKKAMEDITQRIADLEEE